MPATSRYDDNQDSKSATSHKSTQSSRSSVMERAREYNRRIEDQERRAKSAERVQNVVGSNATENNESPRSKSTGRHQGSRVPTRERAMASVQQDHYRQSRENNQRSAYINSHNHVTPRQSGNTQNQRFSESKTTRSQDNKSSGRKPEIQNNNNEQQEAIVSPELLVDALSGHEDGLLAIAERLMEHYDAGYDVMGEAIIDAFADVQKLFQHVVEAAHMEGAAFEASRREEEMNELRKQVGNAEVPVPANDVPSTPSGSRHDEFVDQDVKDILSEAIRKGSLLRDSKQHMECLRLYEHACQSASSLLPVDSDHRGRLQLSIARSESMSPDRACAILRYAMDDVLRSGLRVGKSAVIDLSKRSDMVLSKPKDHPSLNGGARVQAGVVQSSEEALASLVEEMKELVAAPVYDNTPLQNVSERFWVALGEAHRTQQKNEERLEQALGKLKGDYLLAKAEWEEKLSISQEQNNKMKRKFLLQKENLNCEALMNSARNKWSNDLNKIEDDLNSNDSNSLNNKSTRSGSVSAVSISSGLAQSARQIVGSFNCTGLNERSGPLVNSELHSQSYSNSVSKSQSFSSRESRPPPPKTRRGRSSTKRSHAAGSMYNGGRQF